MADSSCTYKTNLLTCICTPLLISTSLVFEPGQLYPSCLDNQTVEREEWQGYLMDCVLFPALLFSAALLCQVRQAVRGNFLHSATWSATGWCLSSLILENAVVARIAWTLCCAYGKESVPSAFHCLYSIQAGEKCHR